jgi:hypothetical protein
MLATVGHCARRYFAATGDRRPHAPDQIALLKDEDLAGARVRRAAQAAG